MLTSKLNGLKKWLQCASFIIQKSIHCWKQRTDQLSLSDNPVWTMCKFSTLCKEERKNSIKTILSNRSYRGESDDTQHMRNTGALQGTRKWITWGRILLGRGSHDPHTWRLKLGVIRVLKDTLNYITPPVFLHHTNGSRTMPLKNLPNQINNVNFGNNRQNICIHFSGICQFCFKILILPMFTWLNFIICF